MAKKTKTAKDPVCLTEEARFTKDALMRSAMFAGKRDALSVVLSDGETYTADEAYKALERFYREK